MSTQYNTWTTSRSLRALPSRTSQISLSQTTGRIVPTDLQLAKLKAIFEECAWSSGDKTKLAFAEKDTGLEIKWIRRWLERQRRNSKAKAKILAESDQPPKVDSVVDVSGIAMVSAIQAAVQKHLYAFNENAGTQAYYYSSDTVASEPAFSLPLGTSACLPQDVPTTLAPLLASVNELNTRAMLQSPSLGYIPLAFPMPLVPLTPGADTSASTTNSSSMSRPSVPTIPEYTVSPTKGSIGDSHASNMAYLSQLLFEASVPERLEPTPMTELSGYLSALDRSSAYASSLNPSVYSNSTSVFGSQLLNPNIMYPPPPVSFQTRFSHLAALTKRIRAASGDDSLAIDAELKEDAEASSPRDQGFADTSDVAMNINVKPDNRSLNLASEALPSLPVIAIGDAVDAEDTDEEDELLTPSGETSIFFDSVLPASQDDINVSILQQPCGISKLSAATPLRLEKEEEEEKEEI